MNAAALFELFRAEATGFAQALATLPGRLRGADVAPDALKALRRRLLSLRSAAGVVRLEQVVELVSLLEQWCKAGLDEGQVDPDALEPVAAALQALLEFAAAPQPEPPATQLAGAVELLRKLKPGGSASAATAAPSADERRMLDLFRQEIEEHASALARGLMLLESRPDHRSLVGPLMRAAHSMKGAARAVRLESGVRLAHALEDHLAMVQRGELLPEPERIELLLRISDHLNDLARGLDRLGTERLDSTTQRLLDALADDGEQRGRKAVQDLSSPAGEAPRAALPVELPGRVDSHLRVHGEQISELLGLAASGLTESRTVRSFNTDLRQLRVHGNKLAELLEQLHQVLGAPSALDPAGALIVQLRHRLGDSRQLLSGFSDRFSDYARRSEELTQRLYRTAVGVRMRPLRDALIGFPRMVRDLARRLNKRVRLVTEGDDVPADRDILLKLEAPLTHLLRNALDHGIETPEQRAAAGKPEQAELRIKAGHHAGMLRLEVSDDGRGVDPQVIRARLAERGVVDALQAARLDLDALHDHLFSAGFSTSSTVSDISGRGVGLDVVRSAMQELGGSVRLSSEPGQGSRFQLLVPISRAVVRTVAVMVAGERYGFPLARIERLLALPAEQLRSQSSWQFLHIGQRNMALLSLASLLELGSPRLAGDSARAVMIDDRGRLFGFVVDAVLGEFDLAVRPIDPRLGRVADLSAAAILPDGEPLLLLDVDDLLRSAERAERAAPQLEPEQTRRRREPRRVLVVDDSISVRELERQLLKSAGFEVELAADGLEGWNRVRDRPFDLVITDVDMPRMNGIELTRSIKQDPRLRSVPVVIVSYRDRAEDRARGLEARADSYLTKSDFQDQRFLDIVHDLIGPAEGDP